MADPDESTALPWPPESTALPWPPPRADAAGQTLVFPSGPLARSDVPRLCERLNALLHESDADPVIVDLGALTDPDLVTIDALARMRLTAKRLGRRIRFERAGPDLRTLISLSGLTDALREPAPIQPLPSPASPSPVLRRDPGGQPEEREQPLGVEERVDPDDPPL